MAKMEHPDLEQVIDVADSAVPIHMASGWRPVDDQAAGAVDESTPAPSTPSKPARGTAATKDKE